MKRLLLDTGVIIGFERKTIDPADVVSANDDVAISVITAGELLHGVELADAARRPTRSAWVETILAAFGVEEITLPVARVHAALAADSQRQGFTRGAYDLLIAATASATNRTLITTDGKAGFDQLPGVTCRVI
ncbi:MAG: PIN domain-containing protein [Micromonosporaceae bacterium]|nr:PIN domain-containing protein [Micromonosporaceae bacterium]